MAVSEPSGQFAAWHLGGRTMPADLRKLLELQWDDAASGTVNRLRSAGVTFLQDDRPPAIIEFECKGRDDLAGIARLAYAQAMVEMVRYSGFVAENADGNAIGYWFGPESIPIEVAPLICFGTSGNFSVLTGQGIAEAALVIGSHGSERVFSELRAYLQQHGLRIAAQTIHDVRQRACSTSPQATYRQLIENYSAALSTTSVPDTGASVKIMTTYRGPSIGPDAD